MEDDVLQLIYSMSKDVSKEANELHAVALEQTSATEEEIFPGFKAVSLKAHKMIALLKSCYEKGRPAIAVQQQLLRESTSGFARAMLDFVQARKNLFLNPFDFLCQQAMSNSLKSLLAANTALVSALDTLRQAMEEDEADDENGKTYPEPFSPRPLSSSASSSLGIAQSHSHSLSQSPSQRPVLNSVTSAIFSPTLVRHESTRAHKPINVITDKEAVTTAAHHVKEAVHNRDSDKFFKAVKDFVESVNRLFEIIKLLSLDVAEGSLKESAVLLVNSGRAVLHAPEDDDVCSATFAEAVVKMDQVLQAFMYACSKSTAGRQSMRASIKVAQRPAYPSVPSPLSSPLHSYTSHTERSAPHVPAQRPDPPPRLIKSSSEETITDDSSRAAADKKSKSNPNLAMRSSQILGRFALSPASSPASPASPATDTPDGSNPNWARADFEAVKRTASRPVINIAHTTPQAVLGSVPIQAANHAALLPPMAGMTRLVPSPSTPITSPTQSPDKEKNKMARSASAHISSPSSMSSISSSGGTTRDGEENAYYEIALTVAGVLCEQYPTFHEEWKRHSPAQRDATLDKIVSKIIACRSPPASPSSLPPSLPSTPAGYPPPLSLSSSSGSATPPLPLPPKPRNKPEKPPKDKSHKDKHEKEKEKHEKNEKHEKEKHKKDKNPLRLIARANSGQNLSAEMALVKSPSSYVAEEKINEMHDELTRSVPAEGIASEMRKKRSKTLITRRRLDRGDEPERHGSPAGTRHMGEFAGGLETNLSDFLGLINSGILSHEKTTLGAAPRNSSISSASIEALSNSITGMRDNLKEVLEVHSKIASKALEEMVNADTSMSDRKLGKKKDKSPQQVLEVLSRLITNAISGLENIPLKGKSNDAMTSALQAVTVNFINTKLKMEDTLEENICSECTALRGCVTQIVLELRNTANINSEELSSQALMFQLASSANVFVDTLQKVLDSIATLRYVMISESSFSGSMKIIDGTSDDVNIWEDNTEILYADGVFRAGNLNKLVETLTSTEHIDNKYLSTFITTYQSFTTPAEFFGKLVQRYNIPASTHLKEGVIKAIKVRVCIVLKYWIENQFRDFDQDMVAKLFSFIEKVLPQDGNGEVGKALSKQLKTKVNELNARRNAMIIQSICMLGMSHSPSQLFFSNFTPLDVAKQLTLIEYTLFSKIHPAELLSQSWNSRTARQHSTHVLDLIQRTNRLSFWVGSLLLWQPTIQLRIKTLARIIAVGQELRNLNNFNTLMGIVAGLSMSAVNRLKNTFKGLDSKQTETLEKLQAVLNPGMSFKCYRGELANAKGPCLPYLGTILSDLTFMEDGNPNFVPCPKSKKMLVNYTKRELINSVLLDIKLFQQVPFQISRMDPLTSFLESLPCAEDKDLYELSLLREPREPKTIR